MIRFTRAMACWSMLMRQCAGAAPCGGLHSTTAWSYSIQDFDVDAFSADITATADNTTRRSWQQQQEKLWCHMQVRAVRAAGCDPGMPPAALPKLLSPGVRRRRGLHLLPRQVPGGLPAACALVSQGAGRRQVLSSWSALLPSGHQQPGRKRAPGTVQIQ